MSCTKAKPGCTHTALCASNPSPPPSASMTTSSRGGGGPTIRLPPSLVKALTSPPAHAIPHDSRRVTEMVVAVVDTGATQHMIPDRSAFVSYHRSDKRVRMASDTYAPVRGEGTALISLNGRMVLIRDVLHVPDLRKPLYSLRAHMMQRGCGFLGDNEAGGCSSTFPRST